MTFFITVFTYHLLIRPYALTRFLFGMKPKNEKKPVSIPEPEKINEDLLLSA